MSPGERKAKGVSSSPGVDLLSRHLFSVFVVTSSSIASDGSGLSVNGAVSANQNVVINTLCGNPEEMHLYLFCLFVCLFLNVEKCM